MSYTITTVADTLAKINKTLFIPGIQRPYVWTTDQIIRLFDSLMRKYPIGTLLLWDLPASSRGDWEIYQFIENFWQGDIHNDCAQIAEDNPCTLVLDGQQRLTSLLIGLKGTYTIRHKGKRKNNAEAYEEIALHIDLLHSPEGDDEVDEEDNPLAEHYRFQFFPVDKRPAKSGTVLWFEVSFMLGVKTPEDLSRLDQVWIEQNTALSEGSKRIARVNLQRLWEMVWEDQAIAYFTEASNSYDRVLDIFIRANDGGTKLSRGDLLMSVITLRWEQLNARDETETLLKQISDAIQPKRVIPREFLLRSSLYLNNLPFSIQVKNFTPTNIKVLEQAWEQDKAALVYTANWLRQNGLYGDYLTGNNMVMLLAYYFKSTGICYGQVSLEQANSERIRQWAITIQFQRLLGLSTNSTLSEYRNTVRKSTSREIDFPVSELTLMFGRIKRVFGYNKEWANRFCDQKLQHTYTEKLLSILYKGDLAANSRRPLSLVQERHFMPEELRRAGLPDSLIPTLQQQVCNLSLAVALDENEQNHYYQLPFEQWAQTLTDQQLEHHHLPRDRELFKIANLPELIGARNKIIADSLANSMPDTAGLL